MCHLLLVLPLLALPIWWLLPVRPAAEIYSVIAVVSGAMYYVALRMMHTPRAMDPDLIIGTRGRVVTNDHGRLQVQLNGEIWYARGAIDLNPGDTVEVTSRDGLTLGVSRCSGAAHSRG
jgi:membrane protein implicated in regulation of membrane protease activity